ncbi:acyltransferase [Adlercreutzia murintestinalis]|jgi:Acetyltransferase (isoleucine patch superfamily)|uniref:acyltransferase n=1 Tax=Adlercreutzia murintestinalis TaxID=2941325 RepID=UPI00203A63D2|nr:acyltransferase [Adlercreutzia murintestinalis]
MGAGVAFKKIAHISITRFLFYNFFSRKVKRTGKGLLIVGRHSVIDLAKGSKILLGDEHFYVNDHRPSGSRAEAIVRLAKGAVLEARGCVRLCYGSTIEVHRDAYMELGSVYINSGAVLIAGLKMSIGDGVLISREVFIYDSDHHHILKDDGTAKNPPRPVVIGDNVWIGIKSTILRGCRIGDGAVIGANSLVGGKVKAGAMMSGNPARSFGEVSWRP